MGRITGNIGEVEREAGKMTRIALDRLERELVEVQRTSALQIRNATQITIINNPPPTNPSASLPETITLAYPMVVSASSELFPNGWFPSYTVPWKITYAFMQADPAITATGSTAFTWKNALSSPTSSGLITFASGASTASGTLNVLFSATQKLYITAPAALNEVQNLYVITFRAERQ